MGVKVVEKKGFGQEFLEGIAYSGPIFRFLHHPRLHTSESYERVIHTMLEKRTYDHSLDEEFSDLEGLTIVHHGDTPLGVLSQENLFLSFQTIRDGFGYHLFTAGLYHIRGPLIPTTSYLYHVNQLHVVPLHMHAGRNILDLIKYQKRTASSLLEGTELPNRLVPGFF